MTDERNGLTVEAVIDRFTVAERLLADAAGRVQALGSAADAADSNASAIGQAAASIDSASEQLAAMVREMQTAHTGLVAAMDLAREFLEATDVTAVRESLHHLDQRVTQVANEHNERFNALFSAVDRSVALEKERDDAQRRLASVMQQIPHRVAKRIQ